MLASEIEEVNSLYRHEELFYNNKKTKTQKRIEW